MRCSDEAGEVSRFNARRAVLRSSFRQFVSRQPSVVRRPPVRHSSVASPPIRQPAPHFFIFFERMHACFSLGIPRSLSLFRCCLVRSSGSFKIHTRLRLLRVTGRSDGGNGISWGGLRLVQSVLLRRSGCIDTENADTSSEPRTQTVQRVARACVLLELKSIKSIKIRVEFGCGVGVSG
jgi:hypothetical protein